MNPALTDETSQSSRPGGDPGETSAAPPVPLASFGWLLAERIARAASAVAVTGMVARHLGPSEFGLLNVAASATTVLLPLASLSAEAVVIREIVRRPEREREIIRTVLALRVVTGGVLLGATLASMLLPPEGREHAVLAGLMGLALIWQAAEAPETAFRRHQRARFTAMARFGAFVAASAAKLALIAAGAGTGAFACAYAAEGLFYGAALLAGYHAAGRNLPPARIDRGMAGRLLRECAGPALAATIAGLALKLDQLLVMVQLGPGAAGKYAAGCRFTELHFFLSATLGIVLYPRLAECHGRAGAEYAERLERHFELMLLAGWGSGLLVALAAAAGLPLLFGADYTEAVAVVWIQSGGALLLFSGVARSHHALLTGAGWTLLASALATLAAQTVLAWWLIPAHGLTGAAVSQGLAAIAGGWVTTAILPPLRPAFLHQTRAFAILLRPWRWRAALRLAL